MKRQGYSTRDGTQPKRSRLRETHWHSMKGFGRERVRTHARESAESTLRPLFAMPSVF